MRITYKRRGCEDRSLPMGGAPDDYSGLWVLPDGAAVVELRQDTEDGDWQLPGHNCNVIVLHHTTDKAFAPASAVTDKEKHLLLVLKLAEHFCGNHRILGNQSEDLEWASIGPLILEQAALSEFELDALQGQLEDMGLTGASYIKFH